MITIEININDNVKVKLTKQGFRVVATNAGYQNIARAIDGDGYSNWQLWVFMSVFGPHLHNGGQNLIEDNLFRFIARLV